MGKHTHGEVSRLWGIGQHNDPWVELGISPPDQITHSGILMNVWNIFEFSNARAPFSCSLCCLCSCMPAAASDAPLWKPAPQLLYTAVQLFEHFVLRIYFHFRFFHRFILPTHLELIILNFQLLRQKEGLQPGPQLQQQGKVEFY